MSVTGSGSLTLPDGSEQTVRFSPKLLPKGMKNRPQWICWRWEPKEGGWNKAPVNPHDTRKRASTTSPATWSSFKHAIAVHKADPEIGGIGYVFEKGDGFTGVDFDGCISEEGELDPWVAAWIDRLGGYAEASPSGTGIHCIVRAELPGGGKNTTLEGHKVEVYDRRRFFTATGAVLVGYETPGDAQAVIEELATKLTPTPEAQQEAKRLRSPALANQELLNKARTANNGWKFRRLYDHGDWRGLGYKSWSHGDFGLINMLIWWSGGDREQIVELFEKSALYRSTREKRGGYAGRSVDNALRKYKGGYYDPNHGKDSGLRERLKPYFDLVDAPVWRGGQNGRRKPSARKVLAAISLAASEQGAEKEKGVQIGLDMRTLSEESHVSMPTLLSSSLPLLVQEKVIRWVSKGRGRSASVFELPLPVCETLTVTSPHATTVKSPHTSHTLGDDDRRGLLRASQGRSPYARIPRVGNAKQVLLEHLVSTAGNRLSVKELAEGTQRRRPDVRRDMNTLLGLNLVTEAGEDEYQLARDFWSRWYEVLFDSGVVKAEWTRKNRHENERLFDAGYIPVWGDSGEEWVSTRTGEALTKEDALAATNPGHEPGGEE